MLGSLPRHLVLSLHLPRPKGSVRFGRDDDEAKEERKEPRKRRDEPNRGGWGKKWVSGERTGLRPERLLSSSSSPVPVPAPWPKGGDNMTSEETEWPKWTKGVAYGRNGKGSDTPERRDGGNEWKAVTSLLYVSLSLRSLRVRLRSVRDETTEGRRDEKGTRRAVEGGGNGLSSRCSSFPCRSHPSFTSHVGSSCSTPPSVPSDVGNRHEEKVKDVRKTRDIIWCINNCNRM